MSPHHGDDEMHDEESAPGNGARTDEELARREESAGGRSSHAANVPAPGADRDPHPQRGRDVSSRESSSQKPPGDRKDDEGDDEHP